MSKQDNLYNEYYKFLVTNNLLEIETKYKTIYGKLVRVYDYKSSKNYAIKISIKKNIKDIKNCENIYNDFNYTQFLKSCNNHKGKKYICLDSIKFETEQLHFLIKPYYKNDDLFEFIQKKQKINESNAKIIFKQLLLGTQFLHINGICHLDLTLENIMFDNNFNIKIIDFGLARYCTKKQFNYSKSKDKLYGKTEYLSPESYNQKKEKYNGIKNDIWSLGIVLYILVVGDYPFEKPIRNDGFFNDIYDGNLLKIKKHYSYFDCLSNELVRFISKILCEQKKRATIDELLNDEWITGIKYNNDIKCNEIKYPYKKSKCCIIL